MTPKEALDYLKNRISTLSINHKIGNRDIANFEIKDIVMGIETHVMPIFEKALTELEELKKRDTPMKLTQASRFTTDKKLYGMYACNSCHEVIPYITLNSKKVKPKFCYHCGQRLDWSDGE